MKKIYNIILLLTALGLLWSCQDEDRLVLQQPDTFTLNVPKYASGIYDLQNLDAIEFTTSQPGYGFTAAANYSVEISLNQDFSNYIALPGSHTSAKFNVEAIDMALALMELHGVELEEDYLTSPHPVYVRLTSVLNDKNIGAVKSNIIELPHVKGYFALDPVVMPEDMYIIGNVAGDWNWDNSTEMIPVWGTPGKFWAVQYLGQSGGGENAQIKFNFAKDWNGNEFGYEGTAINQNDDTVDAGATDSDGNIEIGNPGWYIVVITTEIDGRDYNYSLDFFPPHIHLQGETAGGNWGTTDVAHRFEIPDLSLGANEEFVSPEFTNSGEIRASIILPGHEWWHTEFLVFDGIFEARADGDDQDRVMGTAGEKLYINFTEGTGKIE